MMTMVFTCCAVFLLSQPGDSLSRESSTSEDGFVFSLESLKVDNGRLRLQFSVTRTDNKDDLVLRNVLVSVHCEFHDKSRTPLKGPFRDCSLVSEDFINGSVSRFQDTVVFELPKGAEFLKIRCALGHSAEIEFRRFVK